MNPEARHHARTALRWPQWLVLALLLALPLSAGAQKPATQGPRASTSSGKPLTMVQKQAIVLMVAKHLEDGSAGLPRVSPQQAAKASRIVSFEYQEMARLASGAGWTDMAAYYRDAAAAMQSMLQGKQKPDTVAKTAQALEERRRRLVGPAIRRVQSAGISPSNPKLMGLTKGLAAGIAKRARAKASR